MGRVPNLLGQGNGKLGENIHTWSIPAVETCPGRSPLCETHCYAKAGFFGFPSVKETLANNLKASGRKDFAHRMVKEVARRWCRVVRVHVAGDFYSANYARKWAEICRRCPETTFYSYTRSWRVASIVPVLEELAGLENVRLWFSADDDTGIPSDVPEGVRVAWLMDRQDGQMETVDLVFRVRHLRREPAKRIGLNLVCPVENGSEKSTDCGTCRLCWK